MSDSSAKAAYEESYHPPPFDSAKSVSQPGEEILYCNLPAGSLNRGNAAFRDHLQNQEEAELQLIEVFPRANRDCPLSLADSDGHLHSNSACRPTSTSSRKVFMADPSADELSDTMSYSREGTLGFDPLLSSMGSSQSLTGISAAIELYRRQPLH